MPFCPQCESEFRPGFARCEECDVDLVESLPEKPKPPPVPVPSFHVVYTTTDLVEAETVRILLEGRGIEAEVQNRYSGFSAIDLPTSASPFEITVPAADALEASKILEETQKARSAQPTTNRGMWRFAALILVGPIILGLIGSLLVLLGFFRRSYF